MADSFALYRIVAEHGPRAEALHRAVFDGVLRLFAPAVALGVCGSMRTCWDEECALEHSSITRKLERFASLDGMSVEALDPATALSGSILYARCVDQCVEGAEVLAACHAARLADRLSCPLVSVDRARYCYRPLAASVPLPERQMV